MMNRLPTEIIEAVFHHLHLVQKLECMLVCRRWANALRSGSLLHTTRICESQIFHQFIEMIELRPYRGAQVKRLILSGCIDKEFDSRKLFSIFPNVKVIYISQNSSSKFSCNNSSGLQMDSLSSSRNQIEHIVDHCHSQFTTHLLNSGICFRLTTLVLDLMYTTKSCGHLAALLVNAPALLSLKILRSDITMDDFESLHTCLPKMDSLFLEMVGLVINDTPTDIVPAASIKTLSILFHDVHIDSQMQWLWYIHQKYTRLSHFEFSNFNKYFWKPGMVEEICENGFIPLIRSLGKQLKSFKTPAIPLDINLFKELDKYDCQIRALDCYTSNEELLVGCLIRSHQCRFIQKLVLRDICFFPPQLLKDLPALKSVALTYRYNRDDQYKLKCATINLNHILKMCPDSLESLLLEKALFECDASSSDKYHIKRLTLIGPLLPADIEKFLSNCLPKLRSLTLKGCVPSGMTLALPNLELSHFEIMTRNWKAPTAVFAKSLNDSQSRYYMMKGSGILIDYLEAAIDNKCFLEYDATKPVSCEQLSGQPCITIVCASVQTLIVNNRLLC